MIGLGSYAFFWQHSNLAPEPLTLRDELEQTRSMGVDLFQICDYRPLETFSKSELAAHARFARDLGVRIQLGTKGIEPEGLTRYLRLAELFDASLVRSMLPSSAGRPAIEAAARILEDIMPDFEAAGITLALETYEEVATEDLVALVDSVGSEWLGICLDPANVVARLENPQDCVEQAAGHTKNIHVKDFAFRRRNGFVGFTYSGARMGEGLHDYPALRDRCSPADRGIDEIVEHWVTWAGDPQTTIGIEREWTRRTIDYLRRLP
ncbi:sugar phosphate isomerase/epimerase family protein [Leifsonia aquatica]|uniref:sugar phosphate isomerase/epimerase family protein n=1 Tax=Leifsonia aquatica TaxID=144185 RepID=UPI00046A610A|nr:TIM barrel protein [Leifsonia aquatica]